MPQPRAWPPTSTRSSSTSTSSRICHRNHAARAGRRRPAPRRGDVASDAHAPAAAVPSGGARARGGRFGPFDPDAALRAHGRGHAHGEQRPKSPPRPAAGAGATSTRHGGDHRAIAGRRPPLPSQGQHDARHRIESSPHTRQGVERACAPGACARRQVAARTPPPIASASPAMSRPTTCSWPLRSEVVSSSSAIAEGDRVTAGQVIARLDTRDAAAGGRATARRSRSGRRASSPAAGRVAARGHAAGFRRRPPPPRPTSRPPSRSCSTPRPISSGTRPFLKANAGSRKARDDAQARRDVARERVAAARQRAACERRGAARVKAERSSEEIEAARAPRGRRRRANRGLREGDCRSARSTAPAAGTITASW